MNYFTGTYEHTLDSKGRVIVPAPLRGVVDESDGPGFVLTTAPEDCLVMYTPVEYQRLCLEQSAAPRGSLEFRRFQRNWYANAELLGLDKQGRILLPEAKRSLVKIAWELVFAGCGDHIEIWSKNAWAEEDSAARENYPEQLQAYLGPKPAEQRPEA